MRDIGLLAQAARRVRRPAALSCVIVLIACVLGALAATGCAQSKLRLLVSEGEFNDEVLKADQPVVVYFSKGGCAACMFLDGTMNQVSDEYAGRIKFFRFELMPFWSDKPTCQALWKRYRVATYPTVVLIVGGKERKRWVTDYNADRYRKVLDEVSAPSAPASPPAPKPAPKPPDATSAPSAPASPPAPKLAPKPPDDKPPAPKQD
jgi:thiol-disulfide isomerase/thioredoxin